MDDVQRRLRAAGAELGLILDAESLNRLGNLHGMWVHYARSMNLTGRGAIEDQMVEGLHVVAAIRRLPGLEGPWLDVGSGGGFPGLVVAACGLGPGEGSAGESAGEMVSGVLLEPREKRCDFLELALRRIGVRWRVVRGRLEGDRCVPPVDGVETGMFGGVGARAVWSPEVWWEMAQRWVAPGGWVAVHLRPDDADPGGARAVVRVDSARWSVRIYGRQGKG